MPTDSFNRIRQTLGHWWPLGKRRTRFEQLADEFIRRLKRWPRVPSRGGTNRQKVGVLILPWRETAVPFFSMECALSLAESADVTFIWDPCNIRFNAGRGHETDSLTRCLTHMKQCFPVIDAEQVQGVGSMDKSFLEVVQYENAVARTLGEQKAVELSEKHGESIEEMAEHAGRIRALLQAQKFDWILIPGGVWGVSGIYGRVAEELGLSITSYDCGVGILFVSHDGAAAHYADMPVAFREIVRDTENDPAEIERMRAAAHEVLEVRKQGTDLYRLQPKSTEAALAKTWDILLPLNYRSDTAAMCRQRLFGSVKDWLEKVLAWVKSQPSVTLAIRQHPCEKIEEFRGSDHWEELIKSFELGERCRFIAAEDEVNTYDLLAGARVILPCTSRVGIEAAIFNKPVVLGWESYYQDCGFAWNAGTVDEYFALVSQALRGELVPAAGARQAAEIAYYVAEKCFGMDTVFTPAPVDFKKWTQIPPAELWAMPEPAALREALVTRKPLAVLRNRQWTQTAPASAAVADV